MKSVKEMSGRAFSRTMMGAIIIAAGTTLLGCTRANLYDASTLPQEFTAPRYSSVENVDLSRIARTVGNSQVISAGDLVSVTITTGLERYRATAWRGRVGEDGTLNVPLVGVVHVAGLELVQAEQSVRNESIQRGKFVNPNVSIIFERQKTNSIAVVGAVVSPNTYKLLSSRSDLLTALVHAGGLSADANTIIEIRYPPSVTEVPSGQNQDGQSVVLTNYQGRGETRGIRTPPRTVQVDLEEATQSDGGDYLLPDGATIMVTKRPPRTVQTMGLVRRPAQHRIPVDQVNVRLLDALTMSGGKSSFFANKVLVIRQLPGQEKPIFIKTSVLEAKRNATSNIRLADGDVVSVEETPATIFANLFQEFVQVGFGFRYAAPIPGL